MHRPRQGEQGKTQPMIIRIVTFLVLSQLAAGFACAAGFVPHVAQYELYLDRNALGNDVVASGGRMEIRYEKSCEFWTTTFMFNFAMVSAAGAPINIGFVSWAEESLDGRTYRFEHAELSMDEIVQAMAGTAHTGTEAPAEAIFTVPERSRVSLPAESCQSRTTSGTLAIFTPSSSHRNHIS